MNANESNRMSAPDTYGMQVRYFELMRKRRWFDLVWVPTKEESSRLYQREENGKWYPRYSQQACPVIAEDNELHALEEAIEAAGVRMYL